MKIALILLVAVIAISTGCSDAGQRRDFTLTNLRGRLESMEPGSEADRLRNGIAQIENSSTRAIRPCIGSA